MHYLKARICLGSWHVSCRPPFPTFPRQRRFQLDLSLDLIMQLAFFSGEHSHDDVRAIARNLIIHAKGDDHRCLHAFLHAATVAVKDEIRALPHTLQALVPSFEHVLDLVNHASALRDGPLAEPIERMLLCVLKIGAMIG